MNPLTDVTLSDSITHNSSHVSKTTQGIGLEPSCAILMWIFEDVLLKLYFLHEPNIAF